MSVPNTKVFVDIPGFGLHAGLVFKLNVESSLLVNSILVVVIACGSLRISACIQVVKWQAGCRVLLYTHS